MTESKHKRAVRKHKKATRKLRRVVRKHTSEMNVSREVKRQFFNQ